MRNGFISNSRKSLKNGSVGLKDSSVVECYRVIVVYAMGRNVKDIFKSFHLPEKGYSVRDSEAPLRNTLCGPLRCDL